MVAARLGRIVVPAQTWPAVKGWPLLSAKVPPE